MVSSSIYRVIRVTDIQDSKVKEAVNVLYQAFKDNVIANGVVGGKEELKDLTYTTVIRATIVAGQLHVAIDQNDHVIGTACWFPPGSDFLADEKQQEQGAKELFERLQRDDPPLFDWWMTKFIPSAGQFANKYLAVVPGENVKIDNWTLYSLAVLPEYQRQGISKLLVKVGEDQARNQNLRTIFETDAEQNIIIYKKLGYEEVGMDYVDGPPGLPGYNLHLMVKKP